MNKAQRQFKKWYMETADATLIVDKITCRASGVIELRRSFFYRHGNTPETLAAKYADYLPDGWEAFDAKEEWREWPKTSYWVVFIRQVENWCPNCEKKVEPEGQVNAQGGYSVCSCCGTELD